MNTLEERSQVSVKIKKPSIKRKSAAKKKPQATKEPQIIIKLDNSTAEDGQDLFYDMPAVKKTRKRT